MATPVDLRFPDRATAMSTIFPNPGCDLAVIGPLVRATGGQVETEDGLQPEYETLPGYHVNALMLAGMDLPESWAVYAVEPDPALVQWALA
ncbi:hypothetical protein [Halodurantibacterium flavum]|uniref:Uncharacterized protein n=1 Tax=Halodurantibacterium flavum TaxID=1382802 RepID=A0ABW4S8N6_9RHOB